MTDTCKDSTLTEGQATDRIDKINRVARERDSSVSRNLGVSKPMGCKTTNCAVRAWRPEVGPLWPTDIARCSRAGTRSKTAFGPIDHESVGCERKRYGLVVSAGAPVGFRTEILSVSSPIVINRLSFSGLVGPYREGDMMACTSPL